MTVSAQDGRLEIAARGGELELAAGGRTLRYPASWLRDNCPCADCADPHSGQKLHDVTDIPAGVAVGSAVQDHETVVVTFAPDGHRSVFETGWLTAHPLDGYDDPHEGKELWHSPAELTPVPEADWGTYLADPAERARALDSVLRWGFLLLRDVPAEPGMVLEVVRTFGFVRETNYGRLFDVRIEPAPGNLANTCRKILPHTDNPYRDPVPTIQLLHCLRAADEGGDTGLVDGFAAAVALQDAAPAAFDALTRNTCRYEYRDSGNVLRTSQPLIQLSPRGQVRGVRFNNRSARPVRLPHDEVVPFYAACRRWAELLARPERRLNIRLAPGDCLIFDNTRVLHARAAYRVTGGRHLQGCYSDLDGLASTLAVIRREEHP